MSVKERRHEKNVLGHLPGSNGGPSGSLGVPAGLTGTGSWLGIGLAPGTDEFMMGMCGISLVAPE
jgi:hypothetical protein